MSDEKHDTTNPYANDGDQTLKDGEQLTIDGVGQTEPLERVEPNRGRDISDLTDETGGEYDPHDGEVSEENQTTEKSDTDN